MRKTKLALKKIKNKAGISWQVVFPKPGKGRDRKTFKSRIDAQTFFEQKKVELANFGAAGASMSEKLRGDALAAAEVLKSHGSTLLDAAKFYVNHLLKTSGGIPLKQGLDLLLLDREKPMFSPIYRKSLKHRLNPFVKNFPEDKSTRQVTPADVETFLNQLQSIGRAPATIESYRKEIFTLFSFLKDRGHCGENPASLIKRDQIVTRIEILTPTQCARLLDACDEKTLPSIALGMFCGLRSSELERLDWSRVNLVEKVVVIDPTVARKTGARRVVPIPENCVEWLLPFAKEAGAVQPKCFRNLRDCTRVRAGFSPSYAKRDFIELQRLLKVAKHNEVKLQPWPQNCLRHSAISYALAKSRDESKVASWAGNSPAMIKQHYDSQAMPSAAKAFYEIRPQLPDNVEQVGFSAAA
jgi:integrase